MGWEVIVVGGGHAGVEAAAAAARCGAETLLLTHRFAAIGALSCNPAVGGLGKSHLVREVDALDGLLARAADRAAIQVRVLNQRKGPAVQATRAQTDRQVFARAMQELVSGVPGLTIREAAVGGIRLHGDRVAGVVLEDGTRLDAPRVVLATGTFLAGMMHVGTEQEAGGRAGDAPAEDLSAWLRSQGFHVERLKTGTPPRLDGRTIDWEKLTPQPGEDPPPRLSAYDPPERQRQIPCHLTRTTAAGHDVVRQGLDGSAAYSGAVSGSGPRYCPSIEDKVVRFPERESHTVFLEPEGLALSEVYPNGISTSLPRAQQESLVRTVPGLEQAVITRYGYAIEYDFLDPRQLDAGLAMRGLEGLYLAGQINGTTGYEEAAAQGLLAGLNAARTLRDEEPWWPARDAAYLGVMVDDLVTRGVDEPYRMLTSRAEHRLILRQDNADARLTPLGRRLGVVGEERWQRYRESESSLESLHQRLEEHRLEPDHAEPEPCDAILGGLPRQGQSLAEVLRRPEIGVAELARLRSDLDWSHWGSEVIRRAEIEVKYAGYIERDQALLERLNSERDRSLPPELDYRSLSGLSEEVTQRLERARPETLGQAANIPGITPAALSLLLVHAKRRSA
jgi:tRNA uridine 5-carboxymethylaminomethyl modification enzyme